MEYILRALILDIFIFVMRIEEESQCYKAVSLSFFKKRLPCLALHIALSYGLVNPRLFPKPQQPGSHITLL